ncbi:hypothetical protein B0A54_14140 [Friedmanniomyces endolithicus]|uniref:Uncharacterized protein n=1 Tax=Friedmanniomyces endolithicus TaxID=329885 RepID=A0A4U0UGF4_9PEZI|nr:hypothetical protein B0A54_14140 [Friedmanniomyces endolithicus]
MTTKVPVNYVARRKRRGQASHAHGDVAKPNVECVQAIDFFVQDRYYRSGEADHARKEATIIQQNDAAFLLPEYLQCSQRVRKAHLAPLDGQLDRGLVKPFLGLGFAGMSSLLDVPQNGQVDTSGWDRTVTDDVSACFGEEGSEHDQQDAPEDGQEPKCRPPSEILVQDTPDRRAKRRSYQQPCGCIAHILTSFSRRRNIRNHCCAEGYGGAAPKGLHHAEDEKRGIISLQCQPNIGDGEDHEAHDEGEASAVVV